MPSSRSFSLLAAVTVCITTACNDPAPSIATAEDQRLTVSPSLTLDCDDTNSPITRAWLPAVSDDGLTIVYAHVSEDAPLGRLNLSLRALSTADGRRLHDQPIITPETSAACDDSIEGRVEDANSWLDTKSWLPMVQLTRPEDREISRELYAWQPGPDGPIVTWDPPNLSVMATKPSISFSRAFPHWESHTGRLASDDQELCFQPSFLGDAWVNTVTQTLLVRLYFTGNDACWEPDSSFKAIALPRSDPSMTTCTTLGGSCAPTACDKNLQTITDDACSLAGGYCCVPADVVLTCQRAGGQCAASCLEEDDAPSHPGCASDTTCCLPRSPSAG